MCRARSPETGRRREPARLRRQPHVPATRPLVEDDGETLLRAGDCAAFPKATGNGHHLKNLGSTVAVYLEVGSRHPDDLTTCSDVDLMSSNRDGRFVHKDGSAYD